MTSKEIEAREQSVIDVNGSTQVTIPKEWRPLIGISNEGEMTKKCTAALVRGKHGFFVAVYNPEFQQK